MDSGYARHRKYVTSLLNTLAIEMNYLVRDEPWELANVSNQAPGSNHLSQNFIVAFKIEHACGDPNKMRLKYG